MSRSLSELLSTLVAIPSVNPMGGEADLDICFEGRISDWLCDFFQYLGVPWERVQVSPGRDNVFGLYDSGSSCTLLMDAHQDTVPVAGMTVLPFTADIQGDRMYGRGTCDVKGGMASMLWAFERLVRERPAGAPRVVMSCTCDEEATTLGISHLVNSWSSGGHRFCEKRPDVAVIAEPTLLDVVVAHKGVRRFEIECSGRACHSSDPSQGISAIYRMGSVLSRLEEYARVLPSRVASHPLCGSAALSVGIIRGGSSVNIVPDHCSIEIDRRVVPGEDRSLIIPEIQQCLADLDFEVTFGEPWVDSPPLTDEDNSTLASRLLECVAAVESPHRAIGVPFGTHASRTCAAGVPSVVFGPGSIDQAHTKDEYIELPQLEVAGETLFRVCSDASRLMD